MWAKWGKATWMRDRVMQAAEPAATGNAPDAVKAATTCPPPQNGLERARTLTCWESGWFDVRREVKERVWIRCGGRGVQYGLR